MERRRSVGAPRHAVGLSSSAREEFDALLLEEDPFREPSFRRHSEFLREEGESQELAALMLARAQRQSGRDAADSFLSAADAFRTAGAAERALLCEDQAFEADPGHERAFEALKSRRAGDVRKLGPLLRA